MSILPKTYRWLYSETGPRVLREALDLYGVKEIPGKKHNSKIIEWAKNIGRKAGIKFDSDETAWCGVFVAHCVRSAGFDLPEIAVRAKSWLGWGSIEDIPMLGDVLVFNRPGGGGHVGFYIGEDEGSYHILGGNQGNAVSIARIAKYRCLGIRRCPWKYSQPLNVRRVQLGSSGTLSINEA